MKTDMGYTLSASDPEPLARIARRVAPLASGPLARDVIVAEVLAPPLARRRSTGGRPGEEFLRAFTVVRSAKGLGELFLDAGLEPGR